MKVVHIDSGLGNQMLSYCEYLAMKQTHPDEFCCLETITYEIPEVEIVTSQWNGYELDRIFGIKEPNIKDLFSEEEWEKILSEIHQTGYWNDGLLWGEYYVKIFQNHGLDLKYIRGDMLKKCDSGKKHGLYRKFTGIRLGQEIRRIILNKTWVPDTYEDILFYRGKDDVLTGQNLYFKYKGTGIEKIEESIRKSFIFPPYSDERNKAISQMIREKESVAIHIRRGDMLPNNNRYFVRGYFRKASNYIKKRISSPLFVIFTDPDSRKWCRDNEAALGLNYTRDSVIFVDWNDGFESYRDMQLMTECRHNIITESSFGWWGAYLNSYSNKITISPDIRINSTVYL